MSGKCIGFAWKESMQLGCVATARLLYELPHFIHTAVESVAGEKVVVTISQPDKSMNLCGLLLVGVLSSYRVPLKAQNIAEEFLQAWHNLQQTVIEGFAYAGEGPYDQAARWLHAAPAGLPNDTDFRCLVAFLIGQCICPPLAKAPSLDIEGSGAAAVGGGRTPGSSLAGTQGGAPPVAECDPPPAALLDKLAHETLKEDMRLKQTQAESVGPLFSTMLCHLLYSLAVMVPLHPKAAAHSAAVRGAAFSQLMKVQHIVAKSLPPKDLYDANDGKSAKLFLYVRATACIRCALQSIMGSWFAADFGARFAITEEGGRDFIAYCAKHINQAYNSKTAVTRVLGTPWERMMMSQGPTSTIADLLMVICSSDNNLLEVSKLGGEQALHSLSRHGESSQVKQQATMLLTKLAVMKQV
jgi:hypothetical protein